MAGEWLSSRQRPPASRRGRRRCRATVDGGGVGATWDGATDRWAGTKQGPVVSGWERGRGTNHAGPDRQWEREGNGSRVGRPAEEKEWPSSETHVVFRIYSN
jgi:hypothetical protein